MQKVISRFVCFKANLLASVQRLYVPAYHQNAATGCDFATSTNALHWLRFITIEIYKIMCDFFRPKTLKFRYGLKKMWFISSRKSPLTETLVELFDRTLKTCRVDKRTQSYVNLPILRPINLYPLAIVPTSRSSGFSGQYVLLRPPTRATLNLGGDSPKHNTYLNLMIFKTDEL